MGHHLVNGEFQSDKYPWCKRGFVPLKLTDPDARAVLNEYARRREKKDPEFSSDLWMAIRIQEGKGQAPKVDTYPCRICGYPGKLISGTVVSARIAICDKCWERAGESRKAQNG